jgi:hypothetical protein
LSLLNIFPRKFISNSLCLDWDFNWYTRITNCTITDHSYRVSDNATWVDPGGCAPLPAESALFVEECNFQCLSPLLETPKKAFIHCTKPKFSPEKALVHCTTKNFLQKRHSFIAQNQNFPQKKHSFIAQNQIFSPE